LSAKVAFRGNRRRLILCIACAVVVFGQPGCGGSTATKSAAPTSAAPTSASAAWASRTEQLCREKRAAITRLGYVHITYAGIARVGLPTVKQKLDLYLARLLGVLHDFAGRQRQLAPPPLLRSTMAVASDLDGQAQAGVSRLRRDAASAKSAIELSTAFRVWITNSQGLAARGDVLARELNLPDCRSGVSATTP
jgi:hypothetical protein